MVCEGVWKHLVSVLQTSQNAISKAYRRVQWELTGKRTEKSIFCLPTWDAASIGNYIGSNPIEFIYILK